MDIPNLFYRMAELTEESVVADLIRNSRIKIHGKWYRIGERAGKVVFLDDAGNDYSFSDLSVIEEVAWKSPVERPGEVVTKPGKDFGDILSSLGK